MANDAVRNRVNVWYEVREYVAWLAEGSEEDDDTASDTASESGSDATDSVVDGATATVNGRGRAPRLKKARSSTEQLWEAEQKQQLWLCAVAFLTADDLLLVH